MPTRVTSMYGYFAAAALIQRMRSGKPASAMSFQQTSWNARDRQLVPMPSIWTTMKPSSASACPECDAVNPFGTKAPCGPAQRGDRRQVNARVGIDKEPAIGRERDLVGALALGEDHQTAAIKVHPRVVDVIRVLPGTQAAGAEPDLPPPFVHVVHPADDPFA